jgi:ABC-type sugar transport system permease subunit
MQARAVLKEAVRYRWGYIFVAPWALIYLVFGIYPLLLSFYLTFFDYNFINPDEQAFVGLGNWIAGLTDLLFWRSMFNILYNQSVFIVLTMGIGLGVALLLHSIQRFGRFFRTIYFIPTVVSLVVVMSIGGYLTSPSGPLQKYLLDVGLLDQAVFWKSEQWLSMPVLAGINAWKWFGIEMVILLAGLMAIDPQLAEAAAIDGASAWQQFWNITLPQLNPQIFFLMVMNGINGLQMFTEVFMNFDLYGGLHHQALTPVLYIYAQAFDKSNMGYASTLGLLLAAIIAVITAIQFRIVQREVD